MKKFKIFIKKVILKNLYIKYKKVLKNVIIYRGEK